MSEFKNISNTFWLFVNYNMKSEAGSLKICVENGVINAIRTFYNPNHIGNLPIDIRPVEKALWGSVNDS